MGEGIWQCGTPWRDEFKTWIGVGQENNGEKLMAGEEGQCFQEVHCTQRKRRWDAIWGQGVSREGFCLFKWRK